jgi:hypothetical protein
MTIVTNWHSHNSISRAIIACLALGVARQFKTVLQDQHLLRSVGALFGVPGVARDGDQSNRECLAAGTRQFISACNAEQKRRSLPNRTWQSADPRRPAREVARWVICDQRDTIAGSLLPPISFGRRLGRQRIVQDRNHRSRSGARYRTGVGHFC